MYASLLLLFVWTLMLSPGTAISSEEFGLHYVKAYFDAIGVDFDDSACRPQSRYITYTGGTNMPFQAHPFSHALENYTQAAEKVIDYMASAVNAFIENANQSRGPMKDLQLFLEVTLQDVINEPKVNACEGTSLFKHVVIEPEKYPAEDDSEAALFEYVAALAELTKFVNAEAVKVETNALVISLWTGHVSQVRKAAAAIGEEVTSALLTMSGQSGIPILEGNELGEWAKWTLCNQLLRLRPSRELRETLTLARDLPTWRDFGNYSLEMLNGVIRSVAEKDYTYQAALAELTGYLVQAPSSRQNIYWTMVKLLPKLREAYYSHSNQQEWQSDLGGMIFEVGAILYHYGFVVDQNLRDSIFGIGERLGVLAAGPEKK
ncbi:uncharacterized protein LOC135374415 isoform X1 [Ornithodoros turicata]|uniref:uncharacterized protein LOC135374415 isoform X1 n=1 Tax=Ornithodoros turicata TaxID=34597 RepID=UPI0031386BCC